MTQLPLFAVSAAPPLLREGYVIRWGRPSKALPPYDPPLKGEPCRIRCMAASRWGPLLRAEHAPARLLPRADNPTHAGAAPRNWAVELPDGRVLVMPRWAIGKA